MNQKPNIVQFTSELLGIPVSPCQEVVLRSLYGLPLVGREQEDIFSIIGGGIPYPAHEFTELVLAAGVRSGKNTRILIPVLLYEAMFGTWGKRKAGDQTRTCLLMSQNLRGVEGASFDILKQTIDDANLKGATISTKTEEITFQNGVKVRVLPNTVASARGLASPVVGMDEMAVWGGEGKANDADEILAQLESRMFGLTGARLLMVSSFYLTQGAFYEQWKAGFGQVHPDRLVLRATTALMNPGPETAAHLAKAKRLMDPSRFARDFLCEPSERVSGFLPPELVYGAIEHGCTVRPPVRGVSYVCGVDIAGTGKDAFALALIHPEGDITLQDVSALWTKQGRDSEKDVYKIMDAMAALAKSYGVTTMYGDGFARGFPRLYFYRKHGIKYLETDDSKKMHKDLRGDRSRCYEELERNLLAGTIQLLDAPVQTAQLKLLDRTLTEGGKSHIDHPSGGSDDAANSLAVAVLGLANEGIRHLIQTERNREDDPADDAVLIGLLEWAMPEPYLLTGVLKMACERDGIDATVARLDSHQRMMLRIDLSDKREEQERPLQARLRRAGLRVTPEGTVQNTTRFFEHLGEMDWTDRAGPDTDDGQLDPFAGNRAEAFERTLGGAPMTQAEQRYEDETPAPDVTEEGLMDMMGARP